MEKKFKKTKVVKQYFGDMIEEEGFTYAGADALGWGFFREREGIRQEVILMQHRFFPNQIKLIFYTGVIGWGDVEPRDFLEEYKHKEYWEYGSEEELAGILQEFAGIVRDHGLDMLERMLTPKDPMYVTPEMNQCLYESYESLIPQVCLKHGFDQTGEEGIKVILERLYENKDREFEEVKGFLIEMAALYTKVLKDELGGRLLLERNICTLDDIGPTKGSEWPLGAVFTEWKVFHDGGGRANEMNLMLVVYRQMKAAY